MGIPTLIKTLTATDDSSLTFADGGSSVVFDNTYDEYMFVCTDIGPATGGTNFTFQFNAAGGSGFNETITSTYFVAYVEENGASGTFGYGSGFDQAQGTAYQPLLDAAGNGSDESVSGILSVYSPSSTTYVTNFLARFHTYHGSDLAVSAFTGGYVNATAAVDEIDFKFSSGNFDGVIQMFGIA